MQQNVWLKDIISVLVAALIGAIIARRLRLPLIIGYLFAGIVIGGFFIKSFQPVSTIGSIAEIGVALLLFTLGLEFSVSRIRAYGEAIIIASFIQVAFGMLMGMLVFPAFGFDFYSSLFLGTVFSLSSTAVVIKILSDRGELDTLHGQISTGWLLMQDLYTLPIIIILPSIGLVLKNGESTMSSVFLVGKSILIASLLFISIWTISKRIIPAVLEKIANYSCRELVLLFSVIVCFVFAHFFQLLGFSFALGAFLAGVLLSSSGAHHSVFAEIRPLRDLFATVFFVSLGFILNPQFLISSWQQIISLVMIVVISKFLISFVLMLLLGYHTKTATMVGTSLISVGEFAFILGLLGLSLNLISEHTYMTILSVSFITLFISVPTLAYSEKKYYQLKRLLYQYVPKSRDVVSGLDTAACYHEDVITNHVVILGHGRVGKYISKALDSANIPYLVIDNNYHLVKDLTRQGLKAVYGDPVEIDVLRFARIDKAKAVILAYFDRATQETVITNVLNINPKVKLFCRTHFEEDHRKLKSLGVQIIVQPEFEAAVTLTEKILWIFHTNSIEIEDKLQKIRQEHGFIS